MDCITSMVGAVVALVVFLNAFVWVVNNFSSPLAQVAVLAVIFVMLLVCVNEVKINVKKLKGEKNDSE